MRPCLHFKNSDPSNVLQFCIRCVLQGRCITSCEENRIGLLLYRLLLTDAVLLNLENIAYALVMKACWPQFYDPPAVCKRLGHSIFSHSSVMTYTLTVKYFIDEHSLSSRPHL